MFSVQLFQPFCMLEKFYNKMFVKRSPWPPSHPLATQILLAASVYPTDSGPGKCKHNAYTTVFVLSQDQPAPCTPCSLIERNPLIKTPLGATAPWNWPRQSKEVPSRDLPSSPQHPHSFPAAHQPLTHTLPAQ